MSGDELSAWGVCLLFLQLAAGGCAIGVAMGLVMNFLMKVFFPPLCFHGNMTRFYTYFVPIIIMFILY